MTNKPIKSALVSVFHKEGLAELVHILVAQDVIFYSTGGTASYLQGLGAKVIEVADLTGYPSILAGRVKTLHPKVHGGILARRNEANDLAELEKYEIPTIDLVVVDLYPFEETVASGADDEAIIEKIDIGGIALIRGAAKNFEHVVIVPSQEYYQPLTEILEAQQGETTLAQRRDFARAAFDVSSHYDGHIYNYFAQHTEIPSVKISHSQSQVLRYGENPHQKGVFYGDLSALFEQLNGKELSYNNLVDIDGAIQLVNEFEEAFFAVIKHTNACGAATGNTIFEAWQKALAGDPVSAFGGVLACNRAIDAETARAINEIFIEVLIAPEYSEEALSILKSKKNRILLRQKMPVSATKIVKNVLNGILIQDANDKNAEVELFDIKTTRKPSEMEVKDIIFGDKIVKHLKSNAICLVKNGQLIGSGCGQTSRIDALKQAVAKAHHYEFDTKGAVLASDAFFPFADSVAYAHLYGIEVIVEPGGSVKDKETIDFCENAGMCLVMTGLRHFKH